MGSVITFIGWIVLIVTIEVVTWILFRRKVVRICFSNSADLKLFEFLTVDRMRMLVTIHALLLILFSVACYVYLW